MKKVKKVLLVILILIIAIVALIFILRFYNDGKYGNESLTKYEYYKNVTDLSLYPKKAEGIKIKYVDEGAFQGFHMMPDLKKYKGVVICYGGSEGSPNFEQAERLAKEGYETFAIFMFGMKNQPHTLARIPLEQFEDVLKYLDRTGEGKEPITVLGASKGAEYALNLACKYDRISDLILIAPSAYTFAGLDFKNYGSSWTWKNEEIPYIDIKKSSFSVFLKDMLIPMRIKSPIEYKGIYDSAVSQDSDRNKKRIPVEKFKGDILMIVGEDDRMWNSLEMAKIIESGNKNAVISAYKDAGHIFAGDGVLNLPGMRIRVGGNREANKKAEMESNRKIDEFLAQHHGK